MRYSVLEAPKSKRVSVNGFSRISMDPLASPNEITYAENISVRDGRAVPCAERMVIRDVVSADGIASDGELIWVEGAKLYYMGICIDGLSLTSGKKEIYRMGNYVLIFPDGAYFNLMNTEDFGDISVSFLGTGEIGISTVDENKAPVGDYTVSYIEPMGYQEGDLWAIPKADIGYVMKKCISGAWRDYKTYIKIAVASVGKPFSVGDVVDCYGAESITGKAFKIADIEPDAVYCEGVAGNIKRIGSIKLSRRLPLLDHVAVCGDRLWGCRSGFDMDGEQVRRIYASAPGDPLVWTAMAKGYGAVKDIPCNGSFNGICKLGGYTAVFENEAVTKLRITEDGITSERYECEGVGDMASASLASLGGEIYYKSKDSVCAYNGNRVRRVSDALGRVLTPETGSYGGVMNGKYYVTVKLENGKNAVAVYDPQSEAWAIEDDPGIRGFAVRNGDLYAICENSDGAQIILFDTENASSDATEYCVENGHKLARSGWRFECGKIGMESLGSVYPIKLSVRARVASGKLSVTLLYGDGEETEWYCIESGADGVFNVPIKRKRVDCVRVSLCGDGKAEIYGYELEYSDSSSKYR